jgi:hypothetical protein
MVFIFKEDATSSQSVQLPLVGDQVYIDDELMSDISLSWQDLSNLPTRLANIDMEIRSLYSLLDAGPARCASAAIVAITIDELTAALSGSLDRSLASLTHDIEGIRKATRTYQLAEEVTVNASEQMCRRLPSAANIR